MGSVEVAATADPHSQLPSQGRTPAGRRELSDQDWLEAICAPGRGQLQETAAFVREELLYHQMMMHSSLELTGRNTRPRVVDVESAASILPSLKTGRESRESMAATGTDGATHQQTPAPSLRHFEPVEGRIPSHTDVMEGSSSQTSMAGSALESRGLTHPVASGRDLSNQGAARIRTGDGGFAVCDLASLIRSGKRRCVKRPMACPTLSPPTLVKPILTSLSSPTHGPSFPNRSAPASWLW